MKNKIISVLLLFSLLLTLTPLSALALEGNGTEETPYLISTADEILLISSFPSKHYKLMADIEISSSLGDFSGVLDGNGHTITSKTSSAYSYVFTSNNGTIKNLTVTDRTLVETNAETGIIDNCHITTWRIASENHGIIQNSSCTPSSFSGSNAGYYTLILGGLCRTNEKSGLITNCYYECNDVSLTSSTVNSSFTFGGICGENAGKISQCYAKCTVKTSRFDSSATGLFCGIAANTTDGIIENCHFTGSITTSSSYFFKVGGITNDNGTVTNCYANLSNSTTNTYGIGGSNITSSYYQSSNPGTASTTYGTPAGSIAMKMQDLYEGWDFDNIWAISPYIDEGYPYLRWQYPDDKGGTPDNYTIKSITIKNSSNAMLDEIPQGSFYAEIEVTKNNDRNEDDYLIIATYNQSGSIVDFTYMKANYYTNQTVTFGTLINNNDVANIKAFVWDELTNMTSLGNSLSFE